MRKVLFALVTLVLGVTCAGAFDQNIAIDDALSKVLASALKIKNAKVISVVPFEYDPVLP